MRVPRNSLVRPVIFQMNITVPYRLILSADWCGRQYRSSFIRHFRRQTLMAFDVVFCLRQSHACRSPLRVVLKWRFCKCDRSENTHRHFAQSKRSEIGALCNCWFRWPGQSIPGCGVKVRLPLYVSEKHRSGVGRGVMKSNGW